MQKLIAIVGESACWERIFNFGCKFHDWPAEQQSLPGDDSQEKQLNYNFMA